MPFSIVRNDITNMQVDAIVNTANPRPVIGQGVDSAIHEKAGPKLLKARQKLGEISVGEAMVTPAFDLQAKYVIHTVGPVWDGGSHGEEALLRSCYDNALRLALKHRWKSVAFPLISTGNYDFPKDKALQIAIAAFSECLTAHDLQIYLVVFDNAAYRLSEKLFRDVASYIDEHYVAKYTARMLPTADSRRMRRIQSCPMPDKTTTLEEMLRRQDAGFMENLLERIRQSGQKNAAVYKKANISKQHFSKLIHDPKATITKPVAVALALALELDLEQTLDLIGRAGYTLSNSSVFDMIIRFHIEQKKYNVVEINCVLYEFDQSLLGSSG